MAKARRRTLVPLNDEDGMGARGEILDKALELFAAKGYRATSVQELADALGYGKASLYHYVKSKDDILLAIHQLFLRRLRDDARAIVDGEGKPAEKLRAIIVGFVELVGRYHEEATVLNDEMRALSPRSLKRVVAERDEYERMLFDLVREGAASGDFAVDDPHVLVRAILGMMNWCYRWLRADGPLTPREVGEQVATFALNGLTPRHVTGGA